MVMICCKIHETDGMKPFYVWVQRCIGTSHTLLSRRHAVELGAHAAYVAVQAPSGGISANLDALFFAGVLGMEQPAICKIPSWCALL